ncbi:MAG TPA: hypothetical protein VFK79_03305 [Xanthobacteraceae bacterium]|nr:hypothetical protein [Xanthobacteraceae bacterium]
MHILNLKTASAVATLSLGLIGAATISAHAAVQTQKAEHASATLTMPAGDFSSAADSAAGAVFEGPRLSSIPDAELVRLKNLGGASNARESVDDAQNSSASSRAVFVSCPMNVATGSAPSDVHGAASPTVIIEVTNRDIMIRNKSNCALVSSMSLATFFSQNGGFTLAAGESLFDPRVVYDRLSGRCIVIVESRNSGNTDQFLYVASSRTSSCTTWRRVRWTLSSGTTLFCKAAATNFYDYPNLGYNSTRAVVTANNFTSSTGSFAYTSVLSIDKPALHGTAPVFARCFRSTAYPFSLAPAVVGDTVLSMYLLSTGAGSGNVIRRFRLTPSGSGAGMTDTLTALSNINIPFWTAPPDAVQPNGRKLDSLDGRFQSASKQIGSVLWNVHAVNVGGFSRWRMYKVSNFGTSVLFSRTPTTSTCANQDHLFNPSIDTNSTSTSALAFVTASRTCPSQATAGRAAHLIFRGANASNTGWVFSLIATSVNQFTILGGTAGGASCNTTGVGFRGSCRWGDYSSTQIDPSTPTTAWGFNQLITTGSLGGAQSQFNWTTRGARVGP